MKTFLTAAFVLTSLSTFASTPIEMVDQIDTAREGDLASKVVEYFKANLAKPCDVMQLPKYDVIKLSTDSANDEKVETTPYTYSARYMVVQKCLYGSTFMGAYSDAAKATIITGSFAAKYNGKGGPKKMEDLKFEIVKDVNEVL